MMPKNGKVELTLGVCSRAPVPYKSACMWMRGNMAQEFITICTIVKLTIWLFCKNKIKNMEYNGMLKVAKRAIFLRDFFNPQHFVPIRSLITGRCYPIPGLSRSSQGGRSKIPAENLIRLLEWGIIALKQGCCVVPIPNSTNITPKKERINTYWNKGLRNLHGNTIILSFHSMGLAVILRFEYTDQLVILK